MSAERPKPRPQVLAQPAGTAYQTGKLGVYRPRRGGDGSWRYSMRVTSPGSHKEKWYPVGICQADKGHETADGARTCFRRYLLEHQTRYGVPRGDGSTWVGCDECTQQRPRATKLALFLYNRLGWLLGPRRTLITKRWVVVVNGAFAWPLCFKHQNQRVVDMLLPEDITETIG